MCFATTRVEDAWSVIYIFMKMMRCAMTEECRERAVLSLRDGKTYIIPAEGEHSKVAGLGVVDASSIRRAEPGEVLELCGEPFVVLESIGLADALALVERRAQIITVKDIGPIVARLGIRSGAVVAEVGGGSGYLTMALAFIVGNDGKIVTYERDARAKELIWRNLQKAGFANVDLENEDPIDTRGNCDCDAFVADVPNPGDLLPFAESSLKPGAWAAFYTPSMNQVESVVRVLRMRGWHWTYTIETLERQLVVGEMGVRPSFEMLGHTGYLTFARWLGSGAAERLAAKK